MTSTDPLQRRAAAQLAVAYGVTNTLVFVLSRRALTEFGVHEFIGALFLVAGLVAIRRDDDDTTRYGVRLGGIFPGREGDDRSLVRTVIEGIPVAFRELAVACGVATVILPVYMVLWPWFNRVPLVRSFALDAPHLQVIATNLLAVALTEELFFRGYVQTRIADVLGVAPERTGLRALRPMALPIALTALLFAVTHVTVEVTLARAVVFFPGLLFGGLRVWRGGIGAAVFLHAISNVFEQWLEGR